MDTAILVVKLYGVVAVAMGLGMLLSGKWYAKLFDDMFKNVTFMFTWSIFALVVGLLIVINHNVWEWTWPVIVTLIGWIAIFKGAVFLVYPKAVYWFKGWFDNKTFVMAAGVGQVIFGGILIYLGYFM